MRLVNRETKRPIVEFEGDSTIFHNKFLEQEMRTLGIVIPPGLRGLFHGKDCVLLGDPDFQKAFKEIFYLTSMDKALFFWKE